MSNSSSFEPPRDRVLCLLSTRRLRLASDNDGDTQWCGTSFILALHLANAIWIVREYEHVCGFARPRSLSVATSEDHHGGRDLAEIRSDNALEAVDTPWRHLFTLDAGTIQS